MATIRLELPAGLSPAAIDALRAALSPYGDVYETPPVSYDFGSIMLGISFVSDVLQGADVLVSWLRRTPRGNQAIIRLSDGRTLKMEAGADPDAFLKQLKAALKEM